MPPRTFEFDPGGAGASARLDAFLAQMLEAPWPGPTRGKIQTWIRDGRVTVNGETISRPAVRLKPGDAVEIDQPPAGSGRPEARDIVFETAYADDDIAVIDKPAGLAVHPGAGHEHDTLVNGLLYNWPAIADVGDPLRPGIVHRLDRETSGLLAVALSARAFAPLSAAIRAREVTRRYTALVHGRVEPDHGIIDAPIRRDPRNPVRQRVGEAGRPARTRYRVREQLTGAALLDVTLETGRTHQIRVHFKAIGFPVAGDPVYGAGGSDFGLGRQFLHASGLSFTHPVTGEEMSFASDLPPDLASALAAARAC